VSTHRYLRPIPDVCRTGPTNRCIDRRNKFYEINSSPRNRVICAPVNPERLVASVMCTCRTHWQALYDESRKRILGRNGLRGQVRHNLALIDSARQFVKTNAMATEAAFEGGQLEPSQTRDRYTWHLPVLRAGTLRLTAPTIRRWDWMRVLSHHYFILLRCFDQRPSRYSFVCWVILSRILTCTSPLASQLYSSSISSSCGGA
jgi:hypothetical protein